MLTVFIIKINAGCSSYWLLSGRVIGHDVMYVQYIFVYILTYIKTDKLDYRNCEIRPTMDVLLVSESEIQMNE